MGANNYLKEKENREKMNAQVYPTNIPKIRFDKFGYYFIGLAVLAFLGFWATYFSKFFGGETRFNFYFHFHAVMMLLWILVLIVQPTLIRKNENKNAADGCFRSFSAYTLWIAQSTYLADNSPTVPPVIAVGIPNGSDRIHDMLPPATGSSMRNFKTAGGAAVFADFLIDEVLPYVRARYRTLPSVIMAGHSAAGLFSVDVAARRPGTFQGIIAWEVQSDRRAFIFLMIA
jgi:hypothetical protein